MARVAFIVDRTFDDQQFQAAFDRIRAAGHEVVLLGPRAGRSISGRDGKVHVTVDEEVGAVDADPFDATVIPGGIPLNHLRTHERILNFIRDTYAHGKPVAVMREPGWAIARADTKARGLQSWPSLKRDLIVEPHRAVGNEDLIVSSDSNVDAFCDALLAQLDRSPRGEPAPAFNPQTADDAVSSAYGPAPAPPTS